MTRKKKHPLVVVALQLTIALWVPQTGDAQGPLGTGFTFQGQLQENGSPATGTFDMEFKLYDDPDPTSGTLVGTVTKLGVSVLNGLFTEELDFGDVFSGTALWLEIQVAPASSGIFTALAPLQALTAAPYSLYTLEAAFADGADHLDGLDSTDFLLNSGGIVTGDLEVTGEVQASSFGLDGDVITSWSSAGKWSDGVSENIFYDGGSVGVGTSSPSAARLHVSESSGGWGARIFNSDPTGGGLQVWGAGEANEAALSIANYNGSVPFMNINGNGRVGIGTASPGAGLHIRGADSTRSSIMIEHGAYAGDPSGISQGEAGQLNLFAGIGAGLHNAIRFWYGGNGGDLGMIMDSEGRFGIGIENPAAWLHVNADSTGWASRIHNSDAHGDGLQVWGGNSSSEGSLSVANHDGSTSFLHVRGDGHVGIGTTSPEGQLDVVGRVHADVYGKRVAELSQVPQNTVATFDLCTKEGGLLLINGSSQLNLYQTAVLYLFQVGSSNPSILLRISEGGNHLGEANFTLTDIGGGSSGSPRCADFFRTIELRATGTASQQSATVVALSTLCAGCL